MSTGVLKNLIFYLYLIKFLVIYLDKNPEKGVKRIQMDCLKR